jgi:hypothetical protein
VRRYLHWPLVPVALATLLFGSVSLIFPFGRDQGIHAFIADSALHGKTVYRDVFNIKPPLTTGVHAFALLLFGHSMTAIRLLDLLWTLATAIVLAAFAARLFRSRWAGAVAGTLYPLLYYLFGYWHTAQTDGWLNLPLAAAFLLVILRFDIWYLHSDISVRPGSFFWPGLLLAAATLLKYTAVLALPLLVLFLLLHSSLFTPHSSFSVRLRSVLWLCLGFCAGIAACGLVLLLAGALPAFFESQFGLMPSYVTLGAAESPLVRFFHQTVGTPCLRNVGIIGLVGLIATLVVFVLRRRSAFCTLASGFWPRLLLTAAWLVTALVSVFAQGKFFEYHYLPLLGVTCVLAAGLVALLAPALRRLPVIVNVLLGVAVAAGLTHAAGWRSSSFTTLAEIATGRASLRAYWDSSAHDSGTDFSLREDLALADYIAAKTAPNDRVFIWGYEPLVYFVARRWPVSRFEYNFPLVVSWHTADFRRELLSALESDPPRLLVVAHGDQTPWVMGHDKDSYQDLLDFPELCDFINRDYIFETRVERFDVLFHVGN